MYDVFAKCVCVHVSICVCVITYSRGIRSQLFLYPDQSFSLSSWPHCWKQVFSVEPWTGTHTYTRSVKLLEPPPCPVLRWSSAVDAALVLVSLAIPSSSSRGTPYLSLWSLVTGVTQRPMRARDRGSTGGSGGGMEATSIWKRLYVRGGWPPFVSITLRREGGGECGLSEYLGRVGWEWGKGERGGGGEEAGVGGGG